MTINVITPIWVDDYLDLINYANQLGDISWHAELVQTLKDMIEQNYNPIEELKERLWEQYNTVLNEMLVVYKSLRNTPLDGNTGI